MLVDEAQLASRINHPNVVSTLDVVFEQNEVLLVMEYIQGETLAALLREMVRQQAAIPSAIVVAILCGALRGLHAAHMARAEDGSMLGIVHRDMSPQNIMVGIDGVAKVLDFGVAKAEQRCQTTSQGQVKGKFSYMAPEQLLNKGVDARTDVFTCGIVLWECLTMRRLFVGDAIGETIGLVLHAPLVAPSKIRPGLPQAFDAVVMRALERNPALRYQSAAEFADALESVLPPARAVEIGLWVLQTAQPSLDARARLLADIEANRRTGATPSRPPFLQARTPSSTASTVVVLQPVPPRRWFVVASIALSVLAASVGLLVWRTRQSAGLNHRAPLTAMAISALVAETPPQADVTALVPSAQPSAPPGGSEPPSAARLEPARPATPARTSCNPPYRLDKNGIRRVRLECL